MLFAQHEGFEDGNCRRPRIRLASSVPLLLLAMACFLAAGTTAPRADFRVCNATQNLVGVGIGYRAKAGWVTEGWWHIEGSTCKTLIEGPLSSRFYYLYAEDAERGGRWDGPINMCVAEKEFKIAGVNDCFARGFQRAGFQEYDTGEQASWMVQLTDEPATDGDAAVTGTNSSMRRSRKVKILATIGPASSDEADAEEAVRRGRRRLPHQHEPYRPRADAHAGRRASARSRSRSAGRSASSPICRGRSCASASSPTARTS